MCVSNDLLAGIRIRNLAVGNGQMPRPLESTNDSRDFVFGELPLEMSRNCAAQCLLSTRFRGSV